MKIESTNFDRMHADLVRQLKNENCDSYIKENSPDPVEKIKLTNDLAQSILRSTPAINCNMVPDWDKAVWTKEL